ncbi:MAG: cysteine desulfurase [Bacteroidota bacterium]
MPIDIQHIKSSFPLLRDNKLAYLDSAATTQKPAQVIEAITTYYQAQNSNIHRSVYQLAAIATQAYEGARTTIADFLHAPAASNIVFTRGTTEAVNLVAQSFLLPQLSPDDNVVVTMMEHHSNFVPWQAVCRKAGAELRAIPVLENGTLDLSNLDQLIDARTKLLAVVHVSNSLGTVNPVKELIQSAKKQGVPVFIDGAQSLSHIPIDVQDLDCDFFACSAHKAFGPTGIGALYAKMEHLKVMEPYQFGGEMIRTVGVDSSTWNRVPHKFEAGTPNIAGAIGFAEAIRFIQSIGQEAIKAHVDGLMEHVTPKLKAIPGLKIYGEAPGKSGVLSFLLDDIHPHDMGTFMNEKQIAIRAGHHCTQPLMHHFGIPGTARASLSVYNTIEDMDRLAEALTEAKAFFA